MNNGQTTKAFLNAADAQTKTAILENIAAHYGIAPSAAFDEVTDAAAEHLLDYVTGPTRTATRVLMQRNGFAA